MNKISESRTGQSTSIKQIFNDIDDLPLWNFKKVIETKDLTFLKKTETARATANELEKAWNQISEQLSEYIGVNDVKQKLIMLQSDIERLRIDYLVTRDKGLITAINVKYKELENMLNRVEGTKQDFEQQIAAVEMAFKFQINEMLTSVKRFFTYVKMLSNGRR